MNSLNLMSKIFQQKDSFQNNPQSEDKIQFPTKKVTLQIIKKLQTEIFNIYTRTYSEFYCK